jgi:hypothetical protein
MYPYKVISVYYIRKFLTMAKKSVKLYTDNVLDAFYDAIRTNSLDRLHIPHSDVFYVRTALDAKFAPRTFTLKETEDYMRLEGWKERDE